MKKEVKHDPKVRSFLILAFPTLLIVILALVSIDKTWWVLIIIATYQFITLKQFIDQYHEVL